MIQAPHFSFPFRLSGPFPVVVEQDTDAEIIDCVQVILSTMQGERPDVTTFGIQDQAFRMNGVNLPHIQAMLNLWEPRAVAALSAEQIQDRVQTAHVDYLGKIDGGS